MSRDVTYNTFLSSDELRVRVIADYRRDYCSSSMLQVPIHHRIGFIAFLTSYRLLDFFYSAVVNCNV